MIPQPKALLKLVAMSLLFRYHDLSLSHTDKEQIMSQKFKFLPLHCGVILMTLSGFSAAGGQESFAVIAPTPTDTQGYYIGIHGGVATPGKFSYLLRRNYSAGGQIGYRDDNYRVEIALSESRNKFKFPFYGNYNLYTAMLNSYYDINFNGVVVPFIGAGAGYLKAEITRCVPQFNFNCGTILRHGGRFAYQGIAGIGFQFRPHIRFDLRYRYLTFTANSGYYQNIFEGVLNYFF